MNRIVCRTFGLDIKCFRKFKGFKAVHEAAPAKAQGAAVTASGGVKGGVKRGPQDIGLVKESFLPGSPPDDHGHGKDGLLDAFRCPEPPAHLPELGTVNAIDLGSGVDVFPGKQPRKVL